MALQFQTKPFEHLFGKDTATGSEVRQQRTSVKKLRSKRPYEMIEDPSRDLKNKTKIQYPETGQECQSIF